MRKLGKILLIILFVFTFIVVCSVLALRFLYAAAEKSTCVHQSVQVDLSELQKRVQVTNTSTEPYIVLRVSYPEMQAIMNQALAEDSISACIVHTRDSSSTVMIKRNPYVWLQADIHPIDSRPYISVDRIHWNGVTLPGIFEGPANLAIQRAYDSYFSGDVLANRYFDRLEADAEGISLYSSIKTQ